jgi:hypothetical protein
VAGRLEPTTARSRRGPARQKRHRQGDAQATIEFALVFTLFLMMLLAILDAWMWVIESDAADAAVEQGIGYALAAPPGSPAAPKGDLTGVYDNLLPLLHEPLIGTQVVRWAAPAGWKEGAGTPPTALQVATVDGVGSVAVFAAYDGAGHVTVAVTGYARSFIPPPLSLFGFPAWGLPIDESASASVGVYCGPGAGAGGVCSP